MAWFKEWFNTPYYHKLYQHRDHEEAELFIDNILKKIHLPTNAKVMDLACGKGRHARYLNKHQLDVVGADLSEENIKYASQFQNRQLNFVVHDMREFYKTGIFDAVFNMFTSFGYFDDEADDKNVIRAISDMLKPNGLFVFDYLNTSKTLENLVTFETKSIEGIDYKISRKVDNNHLIKSINFKDNQKLYSFEERVRIIDLKHFSTYLSETDLEIEHIFGDYNLNKFHTDQSDRLIVIARKK